MIFLENPTNLWTSESFNTQFTTDSLSKVKVATQTDPAIPMFAMIMPLTILLPSYFASSLGIGMVTLGTIFLIRRM